MPPSDWTLPLPRSRDRTDVRLLRGRVLQPPAECWMREVTPPPIKQSPVSGAESLVSFLPFDRCQCNPVGSSSPACHPVTGQCVCRAGVEGSLCDTCRTGFFGFSSRGCRGMALRLSPSFSYSHPKVTLTLPPPPPLCVLSSPSL